MIGKIWNSLKYSNNAFLNSIWETPFNIIYEVYRQEKEWHSILTQKSFESNYDTQIEGTCM